MINIFIITTITTITTITSIILVVQERKKIERGTVSQESFKRKEKIFVWILSFINPLIFGAIFYYVLIKRAPKKAKYANKISIFAVIILFAGSFFLGVLDGIQEGLDFEEPYAEEILNMKIGNEILHAYDIINKHFESDGDYKEVDILLEDVYNKLDYFNSEGDFEWQGNENWEFSALTHDSWETMDMYCTVNQNYNFEGWCPSLPNECMIFNQAYITISNYQKADYNFYSLEETLYTQLEMRNDEDYFLTFHGENNWEFQITDPSYERTADPYPRIDQDYEVISCYDSQI